jgi:hypothetical protein
MPGAGSRRESTNFVDHWARSSRSIGNRHLRQPTSHGEQQQRQEATQQWGFPGSWDVSMTERVRSIRAGLAPVSTFGFGKDGQAC